MLYIFLTNNNFQNFPNITSYRSVKKKNYQFSTSQTRKTHPAWTEYRKKIDLSKTYETRAIFHNKTRDPIPDQGLYRTRIQRLNKIDLDTLQTQLKGCFAPQPHISLSTYLVQINCTIYR